MALWQVQQAKPRLSEVIEEAHANGQQIITRHGSERAVGLSIENYRALTAHKPDLKAYLLGGPKVDSVEIEDDRDTGRDDGRRPWRLRLAGLAGQRFGGWNREALADCLHRRSGGGSIGGAHGFRHFTQPGRDAVNRLAFNRRR